MSPTRATVGDPARARHRAPSTTTPSMPFAPRLACARAARPPNHSRSRTGIDEATTSSASGGSARATVRATDGSLSGASGPSTASIAASARWSASIHRCRHAGSPTPASRRPSGCKGGAVDTGDRRVIRIDRPGTAHLHQRRFRPGHPLGEHLGRRRASDADDHLGPQRRPPSVRGGAGRRTSRPRRRGRGAATADPRARATRSPRRTSTSGPVAIRHQRARRRVRGRAARRGRRTRRDRSPRSPAGTVRRGGNGPASATSGSRNGRFRCTGPSPAASTSRRPSDRQVDAAASSATPGSWNQRTARPYRFVWSIVCGAPTSRSSAGRSAVKTSIGTPDNPASTTAG